MLLHCHQKLDKKSLSELMQMSPAASIIFREQGVLNIQSLLNNSMKNLFFLKNDYLTHNLDVDMLDQDQLISTDEFVQKCFKADKIIAWK